ncbi:MAG: arsenate reductase ArsC [Promethearchaeota archaeon]
MEKQNLLVVCTSNSARSQMGEAIFRKLGGYRFNVYSAGTNPHGINPYTIRVLEESGYDPQKHYSKHVSELLGKIQFDIVITVCAQAEKNCPFIPGIKTMIHWYFEDPDAVKGTDKEKLAKFRVILSEITEKIKNWLKNN